MTTKARARKYRLRRGEALAEGVVPAAQRASVAEAERVSAAQPAEAVTAAKAAVQPSDAMAEAAAQPRAQAVEELRTGTDGAAPASSGPRSGSRSAFSGEITDAAEMASEVDIASIRREGLTGRQLRMARRVAHKHGLAPTSDFDAVRLLRARGIDPFQRANMLELVVPEAKTPATSQGTSLEAASGGLPATVPQHGPPAVVEPSSNPLRLPEESAAEIWKIQRDIGRRRRRKSLLLMVRLAFFVLLPTILAGWYYNVMATPLYATKSEFVIQQAEAQGAMGLGGLFQGTGLAVQQDSTTVQSYLQSRDAMLRLDRDLGFRAHFSQDWIDPLQRLEPGASMEDAYGIYQKNVKVGFDPSEGILKMEVIAATPEASQSFSEALIGYAEEQVDQLTSRLRDDQMAGARESFEEAEERVQEAQNRVLDLQERLGVLDPVSESSSLMSQITQFELELNQKKLQLDQFLSTSSPNEARVAAVRGEIARLEELIARLRSSMTQGASGGASLARITGELRIAEADLATRQLLLQQAAQQMEGARIEANRQVRYMAMGVAPVAPDEATYPRGFENTLLAFFIFSGIYLLVSLTASVLREQVTA
ncbi:capsule biosynthesis protein [Tropicimonas sp. IMCC34011]|uniref:capsule biosynthesis protein n=1 Tax=Tropicimonas sp. IMCC34011 TaxID=2248759 RepID=UPI000E283BFC|nr:capsule biosynthesis protein [Tropicimonas sp. IMCC34011]